ncbi:hypothetical protein Forpe1208_v016319 [Fusarium oxysporum f. sp. rapae]|uniref:Ubiquitin-like protease family profile domain-containing protein n=1 Tax=Fusarium oxysporum f. sp. rapae TaxID=485398 RepID=A0A8J5TXD9_FUSOX|nr:hypothetical protein Forpe1208_v016319 [Fusarium oxysporum f. sp. rapae]
MSHHEIGDLPPPVSVDTIAPALLKSPQIASKKPKTGKTTAYERKKAKILHDLQKLIGEERWPSISSTLETGKSDATLMDMHNCLKHALENNLNANNVFENSPEPQNKHVREGVIDVLDILDRNKDDAGLGTTIEVSSDRGTEITVGSGAQHTVGAGSGVRTPSSSSPSPPQPSKTSPSGRPEKRVKTGDGDFFDLAAQSSSEDEEPRRKDRQASAAQRAKNIRSQLKQDEQLNDDTIDIVNEVFDRTLLKNTRRTIVHPLHFKVDRKDWYPRELKHLPKSGGQIYAPLHHESPDHWTLCVLVFESGSGSNSIRLDYYDSSKSVVRTKDVEAFFAKWIEKRYPDSKFKFDQKKSAQQNDKTSCGVFVLETLRRLIESEDVTQTIEPIDAKKRFLDMIASIDTNSPSPSESHNLQVIEAIKALERNGNMSAVMDGSLSTTRQPMSIQPSQGIITKIRSLCESEGIPIAERLSPAKTELKRIAEKEEHLQLELTDAREELVLVKANMRAVNVALAAVSESITTDDTTDDLSIGAHLKATKYEPMSDLDIFHWAMDKAASELIQKKRNEIKDKLAEAAEEERRRAREEVESAERKVRQLTERETHLLGKKGRLDAAINFYESLSYLASDGGDKLADESLSTSDVTPSR